MKAVFQSRYGSPDQLEVREVEAPPVAADEVLVRVHAASIHPDVWHVVTGHPYVLRLMGSGLRRPKNPIPGTDLAGVVASVGRAVTRFRPGDAVFGETIRDMQWVNGGTLAEYASAPEELLEPKPDNVNFAQAAAVPTAGYIALLNLRHRRPLGAGSAVLVNGAGGGVGSLALQIAKARGAHVTGVDHTTKLDMLRALGADEVVDYTREDFVRRGVRYDLIFDVPSTRPFAEFRPALKPDGRYVPIGHEHYAASRRRLLGLIPRFLTLMLLSRFNPHLRAPGTPAPNKREAIAELRELLAAGQITPVIDSAYPLEEVREAFRHMIEDATLGKVVLVPVKAA